MTEVIRYSLGQSSLGVFLAAVSDRGLVAFEFGSAPAPLIESLRARFPRARIREDEIDLIAIVDKLAAIVDHPEHDPGIVLDLRGTDFEKAVWDALRLIPPAHTVTYGAIAAQMGSPRDARDVTAAIASNAVAILVPCHRVIKKDGSLSGYRWGYQRKRTLLAREQSAQRFS